MFPDKYGVIIGWCTVLTGYWSYCACPDKYSSGWLAGYCVLCVLGTEATVPALINILVVGWLAVLCVLGTGATVPVLVNILVVGWLAVCVYWVLELLCLSW
jgi:hypothetical protein